MHVLRQDPLHAHEGLTLGRRVDTMSPIIALHVFYILAMPCTTEDYIHHGVSVGGVGGVGCYVRWGHVLNATNFFICGLPGGIDYGMLFLNKLGVLARMTEKRVNLLLNLMIRWPGIVLCMYIAMVAKHHDPTAQIGLVPIFLVAVGHGGNAAYYCQKVAGNYWVTHYQVGGLWWLRQVWWLRFAGCGSCRCGCAVCGCCCCCDGCGGGVPSVGNPSLHPLFAAFLSRHFRVQKPSGIRTLLPYTTTAPSRARKAHASHASQALSHPVLWPTPRLFPLAPRDDGRCTPRASSRGSSSRRKRANEAETA